MQLEDISRLQRLYNALYIFTWTVRKALNAILDKNKTEIRKNCLDAKVHATRKCN